MSSKRPLVLALPLCLCLTGLLAPPTEAAKVTLEKQEIFSDDGELLGFRDFTAAQLDSLAVDVIADYPTFLAGEVDDGDVAAFQQAATDLGILVAPHPEWDVIALNGYSFPSAGPPLGLPPDLQIPGFDGDTGLYLVQLKAPPAAGWWETLSRAGNVIGYYPDNLRHSDLNHNSNLSDNCPPPGEGIETNSDCAGPVIYERLFCSGSFSGNQCHQDIEWYYFSDNPDEEEFPGGHGTSVASIIAGDPLDEPEPEEDPSHFYLGTGIAPSAQVVVATIRARAVHPGDEGWGMTHTKWAELVARVRTAGHSHPNWLNAVRFASNSWNLYGKYNLKEPSHYTLFSQTADQLVRDAHGNEADGLQEMTLVFSAGNCDPGELDCPTFSPGNAKNVISVGAGRGWSETDSVPVDGDLGCLEQQHHISDIAGYAEGGNSRRGVKLQPESDQEPRYKPDLVAPGSQVAAATSTAYDPSTPYRCFGGTSAAAPAVTAAAVLAEAWYWHTFGDVFPSPAMIKAMLVAHADNLHDGDDHLVGSQLPDSPSFAQGWGRVNLDTLIPDNSPPSSPGVAVFDQDHGSAGRRFTQTGQYWSTQLQVLNPNEDIIAVLVFTDKESQENAANLMMNDLDLKMVKKGIAGTGHTFWGNHFATDSWYSEDTGGSMPPSPPKDAHNTVEVIRVPAGVLSGVFTIRVTAASIVAKAVPGLDGGANNQDFALYVHNATQ